MGARLLIGLRESTAADRAAADMQRKKTWGVLGGEAASLREAPLPQTPSPEEQLAFELCASSEGVPPEGGRDFDEGGCVPGG